MSGGDNEGWTLPQSYTAWDNDGKSLAACRREGGAGSKAREMEGRAEEKMVPQRNGKEPIVWRWPVRMKHSMGEPSQCGCEDTAIRWSRKPLLRD
jgi:hypothetical protein